jgi:hypothetical protein
MERDKINARLAKLAKADPNAAVLLALRRGDPATVTAHREAVKTYLAHFNGQPVRVTIPED